MLETMKKTYAGLALSAFIGMAILPTAVMADDMSNDWGASWLNGMYVSTSLGGHFLDDIGTDTSYTTVTSSYEETYRQDRGLAARLAIGGNVTDTLRAELELGFNRSNQGSIQEVIDGATPGTRYKGRGNIETYTLMGNVWADFPLFGGASGLTPYLGGGVGAALVDSNLQYTEFPAYGPQGSSVELAAQLGAGINWAINETVSLGLGYRLTYISGPEISQKTDTNETSTYKFDDLLSQAVLVTLTVKLPN